MEGLKQQAVLKGGEISNFIIQININLQDVFGVCFYECEGIRAAHCPC